MVGSVEEARVRIGPVQLVATMVVHTCPIEEHSEDRVEDVEVGWHHEREEHQGQGTAELVSELVCDDGERCWVEENVVMAVPIPHALEPVPDVVVGKLPEVRPDPEQEEGEEIIAPTILGRGATIAVLPDG